MKPPYPVVLPPISTTMNGQMFVRDLANRVCQYLPDGWELRICMENGAAWVTLRNPDEYDIELPYSSGESLEQQVNDALCVALGVNIQNPPPVTDRHPQPVLTVDNCVENFMPMVGGVPFRCSCGCNVFHKPDRRFPEIYECNACTTQYSST